MNTTFNDISAVIKYLKSRVSLSDAIGKVVEVKKPSAHMHKALCPFHSEKTPSFTITPDKGMYYCFGCHAGGDLITFYQEYYTLSVVEAIDVIATEYQLDIEQFRRPLTPQEIELRRLIDINTKVAQGLHEFTHLAPEFWDERGINPDSEQLQPFMLGYCDSLTMLHTIATQAGATPQDLETLDFNRASMWEDAIVYPVIDTRKQVLGFKNRPLYGGAKRNDQPKFVGSTNTPTMDTSVLYGFHEARKYIKDKPLVLVEGQHDVLSMVENRINNVVCSDGTSLNIEKLMYLQEYGIKQIVLMFDGDRAGQDSAQSVVKIINENLDIITMSVKIATIEQDADPDSIIRAGGRMQLLLDIDSAVYANQFMIDHIARQITLTGDLNSATGKIDFINQIKPILLTTRSVERPILIEYVSQKIHTNPSFIEDLLREEQNAGKKSVLFNVDGEKTVLAELIRNEDFRLDAMPVLKKSYFYTMKHQHLFGIIQDLLDKGFPITSVSIMTEANNQGMRDIFSDGFVDNLQMVSGNARMMLDDIVDKAIRRDLTVKFEQLRNQVEDTTVSIPLLTETALNTIQSTSEGHTDDDTLTPQEGAKRTMERIFKNMNEPNTIEGIELPSQPMLTGLIRGLCGNRLITIAANQSVGKTTLVTNWISDIMTQGIPWLHFSLEMGAEEMSDKLIGIHAGVEGSKMTDGTLSDAEYYRLQQSALIYHGSKIFIDDRSVTLEAIMNKTRRYIRKYGIQGISIDYIQLMTMERSKAKQKYEELGDISGALKRDVAKHMNIPVVILSQLNKNAVDKEVAKAEDGAGAYKVAQDSDVFITLKEKSDKEIEEGGGLQATGNITLFLDKNRQGRGDVFIPQMFTRENQRMVEVRL